MTTDQPLNILFLCTGNSARSILGEALVDHLGESRGGTLCGYSAGSTPVGTVNPLALEVLEAHGLETGGLRPKSWDEFGAPDAPHMDIIITVCDSAAGGVCPVWPGHPASAHWGLPDPASVSGSHGDRLAAFEMVFHILKERLERLQVEIVRGTTGEAVDVMLAELGDKKARRA